MAALNQLAETSIVQPQFRTQASKSLNHKAHSSVIVRAANRLDLCSTDLLYYIAFDHVGSFSFNQCVGKIQFNDTRAHFEEAKCP